MLQKMKDFFKEITLFKATILSITITCTVVFSMFYFDVSIGSLVEFAGPVEINIDVTTTINIH